MRRVNVFLASLITTITALIILTIIGFNVSSPSTQATQHQSGMGGQMSGMMGQATTIATSNSGWYWPLFAVTVALVLVSVVGLAYYMTYPQMRIGMANSQGKLAFNQPTHSEVVSSTISATPYESIEKTLTTEEKSIINVLNLHQGKYLQKYITKETGLSKLKTHRIVARLAERGIIRLEKTGNTNQVTLADWLVKKE